MSKKAQTQSKTVKTTKTTKKTIFTPEDTLFFTNPLIYLILKEKVN